MTSISSLSSQSALQLLSTANVNTPPGGGAPVSGPSTKTGSTAFISPSLAPNALSLDHTMASTGTKPSSLAPAAGAATEQIAKDAYAQMTEGLTDAAKAMDQLTSQQLSEAIYAGKLPQGITATGLSIDPVGDVITDMQNNADNSKLFVKYWTSFINYAKNGVGGDYLRQSDRLLIDNASQDARTKMATAQDTITAIETETQRAKNYEDGVAQMKAAFASGNITIRKTTDVQELGLSGANMKIYDASINNFVSVSTTTINDEYLDSLRDAGLNFAFKGYNGVGVFLTWKK